MKNNPLEDLHMRYHVLWMKIERRRKRRRAVVVSAIVVTILHLAWVAIR